MRRLVAAAVTLLGAAISAQAGPGDLFTERVADFGTTPKGSVQVHYFRFTNTTNQTLTIGTPRVSCGCTTATVSKNTVAPGETAAVIAYMDTRRIPTANVLKSVLIYVPFLAPVPEEVILRVQTVARDDLLMSPDKLAFGEVKASAGATRSTQVTFVGDPDWQILEATSTGAYIKPEFKLDSRRGGVVTYTVTATLDKDCPVGNWASEIYLKTSNPAVSRLRIPVTVNVLPVLAATPEAAVFGKLPVGQPTEKKLTLRGLAPFKILEVRGTDDELRVTADRRTSSATHTIVVAANPKTTGGFVRAVEIVTDSKEHPTLIIPVTAQVVDKK
jgi:hypothetical protein